MAIKIEGKDGGDKDADVVNIQRALGTSKSHYTPIKLRRVSKQDKEVLSGTDIEKDDAFEDFYFTPGAKEDDQARVLRPPYNPQTLSALCQHNNTLGQLVTTMEVNIDGTGWQIEKSEMVEEDDEPEQDEKKDMLTGFFEEVYPRTSFTTIRRQLRRDEERVGYAYLEVMRALDGTLMFLKYLPADQMRLVKLDESVPVEETVDRDGQEMQVLMHKRERRFAQVQGSKIIYFKEYGASRDVNRLTGEWADLNSLPAEDRGTEVLFFKVHEDAKTAYGVPRWINQIPSVLGSRKAEELNLDFFNSGGLPPALIFIQGGELTGEVRKAVQSYLSGKGSSIHRGGVIEVQSTGGTVDSPGNVRVSVERFGAERMQDSMFENYDMRCEERVRAAFRLPPIFVGKSQDYSFATAFASYTVAEAQVFQPERAEFDEIINNTIMRELDPEGEYVFRSMPLTVNDVQTQLEALNLVSDKLSDEQMVMAVNEATGMSLKVEEDDDEEDEDMQGVAVVPGNEAQPPPSLSQQPANMESVPTQSQPAEPPSRVARMDTFEIMELVTRWCDAMTKDDTPDAQVAVMRSQIQRMDTDTRERFDGYCAMRLMGASLDYDLQGGTELVGALADIDMHGDGCKH